VGHAGTPAPRLLRPLTGEGAWLEGGLYAASRSSSGGYALELHLLGG